jgi:CRISPR/Cas system endoribonuclease Cas6 (RAMP superfamily)
MFGCSGSFESIKKSIFIGISPCYVDKQRGSKDKGKNFAKLDDPDSGRLSTTIQNAMKKKFGGNWFVMGCEADEYCSLTHIGKHVMLKVTNGQSVWFYIAKY